MSFAECPYCGEEIELSSKRVQAKQERLVGRQKDNSYELANAIADLSTTLKDLSERVGEIEGGMDSFYSRIEKMDSFLRRMSQQMAPPQQPQPRPQGPPMGQPPMPPPGMMPPQQSQRPDFGQQPPR